MPPHTGVPDPHGAPETILIVCTKGSGWVETEGGQPARVERGDAAVITAGVSHRYHADPRDPWTIWWMHVVGDDADDFLEAAVVGGQAVIPLRDVYVAVRSLEAVVDALEEDETVAMLITAAGAAWSVLAQVTASRMLGAAATNERVNSSSSADSPSQESLRRSGIRTLCTSPASSVR
jgi:AraC family transcriptional regulator of arabinose operon